MSKDFRSSQIETSKLIASGGIAGTTIGLAIYSGSIASNREGGLKAPHNSTIFSDVGSDVFLFISGSKNLSTFNRENVTLFGGDIVVSGTLYAERQVIEVDGIVDGDMIVTGSLFVEPDANSSNSVVFRQADGTDIFVVDSSTPMIQITGSVEQTGDLSLLANSRLRFNKPGENDQTIYGNNSTLNIDADDVFYTYADSLFTMQIGESAPYTQHGFYLGRAFFNLGRSDTDFIINTDNYYGTFFVDGGDETVIIGHEGFGSTPAASTVDGYGNDVKILLSGTAGTKDTSTRGVVLLPGDVVISGSLYGGSPLKISSDIGLTGSVRFKEQSAPSVGSNEAVLYAKDDSGVTKLFMKQSDGAEIGPLGTGGSLDDSYDTPPGGGARSSGSGRFITADGGPVQIDISGVSNTQGALAITGSTSTVATTDTLITFLKETNVLNTTFASKNRNFLITNHVPDSVSSNEGSIIINPDNNKGVVSIGNNSDSSYLMFRGNTSKNGATGYIASYNGSGTGGVEKSEVGLFIQGLGGVGEKGVAINDETGRGSPDFRVRGGTNKEGAILVDWGDEVVILGANVSSNSELEAEARGNDVLILLSGSVDTIGTSNQGVVLLAGDGVTSGSFLVKNNIMSTGSYYSQGNIDIDGSIYLIACSSITFDSGGSSNISITAADSNRLDITSPQIDINGLGMHSGNDVILFISGSKNAKDGLVKGVSVFGGDVVISGSLYPGNNNLLSMTGSLGIDGDLNLETGHKIYLNADGDNDVFLYSTSGNDITIDGDDNVSLLADTQIQFNGSTNNVLVNATKFHINTAQTDVDTIINTNNYVAFYADGNDETIIIGNQELLVPDPGNPGFNIADTPSQITGYGNDVRVLIDGQSSTKDSSTRGVTLLKGDVVVSGTLYDGSGNIIDATPTVTGTFNVPTSTTMVTTSSVSFSGNEGFNYTTANIGNDAFFFVSGTIGSKGTATAGTAVFGGDVVISGTLYGGSPLKISGGMEVTGSLTLEQGSKIVFPVGAGLTGSLQEISEGVPYLIAGSNISLLTSSNGQVTITASGVAAGAGGSNTQVIFNDAGAQAGDANFTFNNATNTLTVTNISGSLTQLSDGTQYIIPGTNISTSTGSNGAITISSTDTTYTAGNGLDLTSTEFSLDINGLSADVNAGNLLDSIAIADNSDSNTVKKITLSQLQTLIDTNTTYTAGDGLDLVGTEFSLDLKVSGGLKIDTTELAVEPSDFAGTGLEDDGSDNLRISTSAAGNGLTGGGGLALSVGAGTGITVNANDIAIGQDVGTGADVTFGTVRVDDATASTSTTTGALIVDGGVGIAGDVHLGGYLAVDYGITRPTSVLVNTISATYDNNWLKIAQTFGTHSPADTSFASFLVSYSGYEYSVNQSGDFAYIINVKFTPATSSPWYFSSGTYITVEPLNAENLDGFDPTTDVMLTFDNTAQPTVAELWVKCKEDRKHCFVTHIGGTNQPDTAYTDTGFEILTGQFVASSATSLGTDIFGEYTQKIFNSLTIGRDTDGSDKTITFGHATLKSVIGIDDDQDVFAINTDASFEATNDLEIDTSGNVTIGNGNLTVDNGTLIASAASLPGSILGITVSNPTTSGLYTVTTTENFISDTSPSTGKARVTFTAPNSGNVEIVYQSGLSITDDLAATLYLGLGTDGTTFGNGDIAGTQNVVYDADTGRSGARVIIHHKWIMTGLTPGSSYTYYIGASADNNTTFDIVWGDNDSDLYYPPLIVEARALPSITTM